MEHVTALAITDASLVPTLARDHRERFLSPSVTRGAWGVGFHHNGEILIKKRPITAALDPVEEVAGVPSRQLVTTLTDFADGTIALERCMPLRYRNWLFAMSGTSSLGEGFYDRARERLTGFVTPGRWMETGSEAVMMLFVRALQTANVLEHRGLTTEAVHAAIAEAVTELGELADDRDAVGASGFLHFDGHMYGLALGRPLRLESFAVGDERGRRGRGAARAVLLSTDEPDEESVRVAPWTGVELRADCEPRPFDL